jgi:hypothetical protein
MSGQLASIIIDYAKNLPPWQKILAKAAFSDLKELSNAPEIDSAIHRFLKDAKLSDKDFGAEEIKYIDELQTLSRSSLTTPPRLVEVRNCKHINALAQDQAIKIAPKLTIVYGENGSGKSGYSRLMNSAFFSRGDKQILPNILKPKHEHGSASAEFEFHTEQNSVLKNFPQDISHPEFKQFACFDSDTVPVHLDESNELYVMPVEMLFFDRLAQLVAATSKKLNDFLRDHKKPNSFVNHFDGESEIKNLILSLNEKSSFKVFEEILKDTELTDKNLEIVEKQYHELMATDPKKTVLQYKQIISELESYEALLCGVFAICDAGSIGNLKILHSKYVECREKALSTGIESFKTQFLNIVGSDEWRTFINSASAVINKEQTIRSRQSDQHLFQSMAITAHFAYKSLRKRALSYLQNIFLF